MPKCGENDKAGKAWFNFLCRLDLGEIGIRFLEPEEMYDYYLRNGTKSLTDLDKDLGKGNSYTMNTENGAETPKAADPPQPYNQ